MTEPRPRQPGAHDRRLQGEIAGRPDVAPPLGEQQVDFRRPAADALHRSERGDRFLVVPRQRGEIKPPARHFLGEAAGIGDLLATETGATQCLFRSREDRSRILGIAHRGFHLAPDRPGGGHAHLLADDRAQQRGIAGFADARLGIARGGERGGETRLDPAQRIERCAQLFGSQAHRRHP